jgi:hypothetical protein
LPSTQPIGSTNFCPGIGVASNRPLSAQAPQPQQPDAFAMPTGDFQRIEFVTAGTTSL